MQQREKGFCMIYPFATENVSGYFEKLDLFGTDVLTVGSSLDQLFNAIVFGAKKITVLDINPYVEDYFYEKRNLLLKYTRDNFYDRVMLFLNECYKFSFSGDILSKEQLMKINRYLRNDNVYNYLRERLNDVEINFVIGDIFKMEELGISCLYDRIILSNVLQYMDYFYKEKDNIFEWLKECFLVWNSYLKEEGILQLLYLYSYDISDIMKNNHPILTYNLKDIWQVFHGYALDIELVNGIIDNKDAIVTYTKKLYK